MKNRRQFLLTTLPALGLGLLGARTAEAAAAVKLTESDPAAQALGYREDASKVDAKKYPMFKADSRCGNCVQFSGKATDASGPCGAFGGKLVSSKGWCMAWAKKA